MHDSGQQQTDSEILNSSFGTGTMLHVQHVQCVIFEMFENKKALFSQVVMSPHSSITHSENATKLV